MVTIGYIDIGIAVLLLGGLILGLIKGFSKKHLSAFAGECGYLVAYFLGGPLARFLAGTDISFYIQNGYQSALPSTEAFTAVVSSDLTERTTQLSTALTEMNIPTFFQGFITNRVTDTTSTVSAALASALAYFTIIAAVFAILYLAVFLIIKLIFSPLWAEGSVFGEKGKSVFGRICGAIRNLAKASFFVLGAMFAVSLANQLMVTYGMTALNDFLVKDLDLANTDSFSIGKLIYNSVSSIVNWITLNGLHLS